jgi:hypothetical protein
MGKKKGTKSIIPRAVAEEVIDEPLRWAKKIRGKGQP